MTTSPSTTAGKTTRPDVRRGAREGGRVVKAAVTGTARDILLPLCGHTIRNSSSHITYQAARPRWGKRHTRGDGKDRRRHHYSGLETRWSASERRLRSRISDSATFALVWRPGSCERPGI